MIHPSWRDLTDRWESLLASPPGLVCLDFDNSFLRGDFGEKVMEALLVQSFPRVDRLGTALYQERFRDPDLAQSLHTSQAPSAGKKWRDFVLEEYDFIRTSQGLGASYRWSSFLFSGWEERPYREFSRRIWLENLAEYRKNPPHFHTYPMPSGMAVHPREPVLDLVREFQKKGWKIAIITASPTWTIQEATPELGLPKDSVFGMNLEVSGGVCTPTILEPYPYGEGKVAAIRQNFHQDCDVAFGDTINDFPMLASARQMAVLFNRGYEDLNRDCRERGIHVVNWI